MDINVLLRKYMDGNCSVHEEKIARRWLDEHIADPAADNLFEQILDETPESDDRESLRRSWMNIERFIDMDSETRRRTNGTRRLFRWINLAAVAAVLTAFFILFKSDEPVEWHEVYAGRGESERIVLCDGTQLWLNAGTKVIYPSRFDSKVRNIFVDGEIYADVTSDKNRPFIVSTSKINVKVHGTQFSVKAFAEMQNVEVALINGSVTVGDNENEVFSRTLKPGELIRYNHQFGTVEEYDINPETYGSWKNCTNMRFINQSLGDITEELERRFNVDILIEDKTLAQTQYYASFINNEGLDKILQALNSNEIMKISRRHDVIVISPNDN